MKLSLNFLNRWENALFKKYNEEHDPVSAYIAKSILYVALATVVIAFIMQMFAASTENQELFLSVIIFGVLAWSMYKAYPRISSFSTVGVKIGYTIYILILFNVCAALFISLASLALMLVLGILVIWFVLKLVGDGSSKGKKKIRVHYNDGSSEEMEEDGRGILGERYFKNKESGNTYVD